MSQLPWSEKLVTFQINPDAADRFDISKMSEELCELRGRWAGIKNFMSGMKSIHQHNNNKIGTIECVIARIGKLEGTDKLSALIAAQLSRYPTHHSKT